MLCIARFFFARDPAVIVADRLALLLSAMTFSRLRVCFLFLQNVEADTNIIALFKEKCREPHFFF